MKKGWAYILGGRIQFAPDWLDETLWLVNCGYMPAIPVDRLEKQNAGKPFVIDRGRIYYLPDKIQEA